MSTFTVSTNARSTFEYLTTTGGFSAAAACGILGNIHYESNFNPAAQGDKQNGRYTSFGICQWHNTRGTNMKKYVGSNWASNLTGQLKFLVHELQTSYSGLYNTLLGLSANTVSNAKLAADNFVRRFEVPANIDAQSELRQNKAQDYFDALVLELNVTTSGNTVSSTTTASSTTKVASVEVNVSLVRTANFTLKINRHKKGELAYRLKGGCDDVPILSVPQDTEITFDKTTKKAEKMLGYIGFIQNVVTDKYTYCILADTCGKSAGWSEISVKAAKNLGYSDKEIKGSINDRFSIGVINENPMPDGAYKKWLDIGASKLNDYIQNRGAELASVKTITKNLTAAEAVTAENITEVLDIENLMPYILILNEKDVKIDYDEMKKLKVSGVICKAGYLFTESTHKEQASALNPALKGQVEKIQAAGLPYGLYWVTRAKSQAEAREELSKLKTIINRYPAGLGVFIKIELTSTVSINDKIMNVYYNELVSWGLKGKIGVYASASQLKKITWEKHCEEWILLLNKRVNKVSEIPELADPTFFKLS